MAVIESDKHDKQSLRELKQKIPKNSPTIIKYKNDMVEILSMYSSLPRHELEKAVDYSVSKRLHDTPVKVDNTYTKKVANLSLLQLTDWIAKREPIVTAHGTMFKKHGDVPAPLLDVIQLFLDKRGIDKDKMLEFDKGTEQYEKYNLFQQLDKIDCNGIYGILGMFSCLIFNINVAGSVTAQGRALIATVTMFFESFLNNNVKFGSLDEVLMFIKSICDENRKYPDDLYLSHQPTIVRTFTKIIMSCGYRWFPDEEEMQIIWDILCGLGQRDLNRIYYKNNLYEFLENEMPKKMILNIMKTLKNPFFNSLKPPEEIVPLLDEFAQLLKEFVYYDKMIMDRIDRCANMIKSTIMISDTDSCIVSLDAWYRFVLNLVKDEDIGIKKYDPIDVLEFFKKNEFGEFEDLDQLSPLFFAEDLREEHYDFENDEIIYEEHGINPFIAYPQDYLRYSIINIMGYVIDVLVNDYLEKFTKNNNSWSADRPCKIILKNEFTFLRILMSLVKKQYASIMGIQEGNVIPKDQQLAITGIDKLAKSSTAKSTRDAFTNILLEEILYADTIDQFRILEKLAIMENKVIESIQSGDVKFYKPVTIKAMNAYKDPMSEQGIKASVVWNSIKDDMYPGINLEERNAILVAKTSINKKSVEELKEDFPEQYQKLCGLLDDKKFFKGSITSIAIPLDVKPPEWFLKLIDYKAIVNDNVGGFLYDSVGLVKLSDNTNYSNILQL